MMQRILVLASLVLLAACSGGRFVPSASAFSGTMTTESGPIGQFSFTVTEGQFGGTGVLTIDGNLVPVSISGLFSGHAMSGQVRNVTLGGGDFVGAFSNGDRAAGTFTYVDSAELVSLTGTWQASTAGNP